MTTRKSLGALLSLAVLLPSLALAQVTVPQVSNGYTRVPATAVVQVDATGNAIGTAGNPVAVSALPQYTNPASYTGAVLDMRAYGSVTFSCTVAPTAGTIKGSPDNASDFVTQTAVVNSATGITTTTTTTLAGTYTVPGHQYVQVTGLTGGTCFYAGGQ